MNYISNFIVQSPIGFLAFILLLAGGFFIFSMYFLLKKAKKEDQIQNAIKLEKLAKRKIQEEYKAQYKSINKVRKKFRNLKH